MENDHLIRCPWANRTLRLQIYHDRLWGCYPIHNDQTLFALLSLEIMQAGLSWDIVLRKEAAIKNAFYHFDPRHLVQLSPQEIDVIHSNPSIIRNKRKIEAIIHNAHCLIALQKTRSLQHWLWAFQNHQPRINHWQCSDAVPRYDAIASQISQAFKHLGFKGLGPTTVYSLMQAIGMVNDHLIDCFRHTIVTADLTKK